MRIHTGLNFLAPLVLLAVAAACAGAVAEKENASSCSVGAHCRLSGTLKILRGMPASVGVLDTAQGCVPLALPPNIYGEYRSWNRQHVVVVGEGFAPSDAADVTWVQLKDRKVATGVCNSASIILYVTQIEKG